MTQEGPVGKVNWSRVVRGGLLWAAVYGGLGALLMYLFLAREFIEALEALGRPLQLSPSLIAFLVPFCCRSIEPLGCVWGGLKSLRGN